MRRVALADSQREDGGGEVLLCAFCEDQLGAAPIRPGDSVIVEMKTFLCGSVKKGGTATDHRPFSVFDRKGVFYLEEGGKTRDENPVQRRTCG